MFGSSSIGVYKRDDLYKSFDGAYERRFYAERKRKALLDEWVLACKIILDGKPFSFEKHEYLREPYHDPHPHVLEMKATQLGLTVKAALRSIHGSITGKYPRGVLYLFPTKTDVTDFSKGRITPLITDNEDSIARWIIDTDSANLKQIGSSFLYLRGMQSRVGLKSVPADFLVFDELDEAPQASIKMAMERMAHSDVKERGRGTSINSDS
jgi:hypothetical protein